MRLPPAGGGEGAGGPRQDWRAGVARVFAGLWDKRTEGEENEWNSVGGAGKSGVSGVSVSPAVGG